MDQATGLLMLLSLLIPKGGGQSGPPGPPGPPGTGPFPMPPAPPVPPGVVPPMPNWGVLPVTPPVVPAHAVPPPIVPPFVMPPIPGAGPSPIGPTPAQSVALTMGAALHDHGYKQYDQGIYQAFQRSVGLKPDGFPGKGTMTALVRALQAAGAPLPQVRIYPWKATGAYDGVNAPTMAEWMGSASAPAPHVSPGPGREPASPSGPPSLVGPYPGPGSWHSNHPYIAKVQNALAWLGYNPGPVNGLDSPLTEAAVKQFQAHAGLKQDGQAGLDTANALDHALQGAAS